MFEDAPEDLASLSEQGMTGVKRTCRKNGKASVLALRWSSVHARCPVLQAFSFTPSIDLPATQPSYAAPELPQQLRVMCQHPACPCSLHSPST